MNWNNLIINADVPSGEFSNIQLITLSSHYRERVTNHVVDNMSFIENESESQYFDRIEREVDHTMNAGSFPVKEFIKIDDDMEVVMCIDQDFINDDVVMSYLNRLTEIELTPDSFYEFGERKSFKPSQSPKLHS